jgi:hypothetical protein
MDDKIQKMPVRVTIKLSVAKYDEGETEPYEVTEGEEEVLEGDAALLFMANLPQEQLKETIKNGNDNGV